MCVRIALSEQRQADRGTINNPVDEFPQCQRNFFRDAFSIRFTVRYGIIVFYSKDLGEILKKKKTFAGGACLGIVAPNCFEFVGGALIGTCS